MVGDSWLLLSMSMEEVLKEDSQHPLKQPVDWGKAGDEALSRACGGGASLSLVGRRGDKVLITPQRSTETVLFPRFRLAWARKTLKRCPHTLWTETGLSSWSWTRCQRSQILLSH